MKKNSTWRSGAELGPGARSQADNHGLTLAKEFVFSSPTFPNLFPWLGMI